MNRFLLSCALLAALALAAPAVAASGSDVYFKSTPTTSFQITRTSGTSNVEATIAYTCRKGGRSLSYQTRLTGRLRAGNKLALKGKAFNAQGTSSVTATVGARAKGRWAVRLPKGRDRGDCVVQASFNIARKHVTGG